MSLLRAFQQGVGSIVIIDDAYFPPNPDSVRGEALTDMYQALSDSPADSAALSTLLGMNGVGVDELVNKLIDNLPLLYTAYGTGRHIYLQPLFSDLDEQKAADLRRVRLLEAELAAFFQVTPKTFSNLDEARTALSACSLVFVDFFLKGVSTHEDARRLHASVKDELGRKFSLDERMFPKVVVLISSSLPDTTELAFFRKETGVRSAFFHTFDKSQFSAEEIKNRLQHYTNSYESASQINTYLEIVENGIVDAAESLSEELRRLELHDLTILKTLRLDGESDTPQAYLTMLLAEALAARIRSAAPLQVQVLPEAHTYGDAPFDGKLLPTSVLFELFTDIAVAPVPAKGEVKVAFGDVFEVIEGDDKGKLFLAISPACDLQRCEAEYQVLCVPGIITDKNSSLSKLIRKRYQFGKGNLLLKLIGSDGLIGYNSISFDIKRLQSISAAILRGGVKFSRIARLTEIFAQEVKTLALNHASRVGVPIDPSFSVGLQVKVRYGFPGDSKDAERVEGSYDIDGTEYFPAVMAMGREPGEDELQRTIMFSHQFRDWLQQWLAAELASKASRKLQAVADHFKKQSSYKVAFEKGKTTAKFEQVISVRYSEKEPEDGQVQNFEILAFNEDS